MKSLATRLLESVGKLNEQALSSDKIKVTPKYKFSYPSDTSLLKNYGGGKVDKNDFVGAVGTNNKDVIFRNLIKNSWNGDLMCFSEYTHSITPVKIDLDKGIIYFLDDEEEKVDNKEKITWITAIGEEGTPFEETELYKLCN